MGRKPIYSDDQCQEILNLYSGGKSLSEIASMFNIHKFQVRRLIERAGGSARTKKEAMEIFHGKKEKN